MDTNWQTSTPAPVLILGLGNILLADDGVGPALLERMHELYAGIAEVECMDGGTQGLALLGHLAERKALVLLDAYSVGKAPGEISVLSKSDILATGAARSTTAHEGNAGELLAVAHLMGELPGQVFLVGVEPERLRTEIGLSPVVTAALPSATVCARGIVERVLTEMGMKIGATDLLKSA
jgi:hydrogenase maturation protease